ncbi:MAG TPA: hypothetical protein VJT81_18900 [Burkholderiales bacterium]|nr:hypothetical protein [Burkholderiales bacterium]
MASGLKEKLEEEGLVVRSELAPASDTFPANKSNDQLVLCHPRIPFVSYPYEWCFSMLKEAATLHLTLIARLFEKDLILKDASAFNVQFVGARRVFIDAGSVQRYETGMPWAALGQFCSTMLSPLLISAFLKIPFSPFLRGSLGGMDSRLTAKIFGGRYWWHPTVLKYVYLHAFLEQRYSHPSASRALPAALHFTREMLHHMFVVLARSVERLAFRPPQGHWAGYTDTRAYSGDELAAKNKFVSGAFERMPRRKLLWDLGCNTGEFSFLAAPFFDYVVAMDADFESVEMLFSTLRRNGEKRILPLVMDLANPSAGCGWNNRERQSLFARGKPDCLLALALIHHLRVTEGIPLSHIVNFISSLADHVIVEFVAKDDPMFKTLAQNRRATYDDYTETAFRSLFGERCRLVDELRLTKTRWLMFFSRP